MHIRNPLTRSSSMFISSVLLVIPLLCWFAVFMYVVFGQTYFMDEVFSKIAGAHPLIAVAILAGLPFLAIFIVNLANLDLLLSKQDSVFRGTMKLNPGSEAKFITFLSVLLAITALFTSFGF